MSMDLKISVCVFIEWAALQVTLTEANVLHLRFFEDL